MKKKWTKSFCYHFNIKYIEENLERGNSYKQLYFKIVLNYLKYEREPKYFAK